MATAAVGGRRQTGWGLPLSVDTGRGVVPVWEGVAFSSSHVVVGGCRHGTWAVLGQRMPGRRPGMAGYMGWLFGEQRGGWCWRCASSMWMARYVVVGDPGEAVTVDGGKALIWILCSWLCHGGVLDMEGHVACSHDVVGVGSSDSFASQHRRQNARGSCCPLGALSWSSPFPTNNRGENLCLPWLTRRRRLTS